MSAVESETLDQPDQLAKFLGHDINVHHEFYQLPLDIVQTAQLGKVLMSMKSGSMESLRGISLD